MHIDNLRNGVSHLQLLIMMFVDKWGKENTTPIHQSTIVQHVVTKDVPPKLIIFSIRALVRKGYLRRSVAYKTSYVQLRPIKLLTDE